MHIMHSVNNHNRTRVGTTVVPTHSRPCFHRGKLVPAEAGSGNPGSVPRIKYGAGSAEAGNQKRLKLGSCFHRKHWIPGQARNDKPVNICVVMYKKDFVLKNQSGAALVIALVMMIVFTLIGLASIFTSTFEIKISGNKKGSTNAFYSADGGIQVVTANIQNFATPPTHVSPYYPFTADPANNVNYTYAAANSDITYISSMLGAPRGLGVSATNFEFQHYVITCKGTNPTDLNINPSTCIIREKVVRLVPTQQGGY